LLPRKNRLHEQFTPAVFWLSLADYFFAGGKSVQLPCATSAAMPMLSPKVGCG
jgi:hypothetical protein